ncbi:MAG: DNA repair protein RadA, partial [Cyanobacteria bacterium P01_F01_bin.86]
MAKSRSIFVCSSCGAESSQYFGRCSVCGSWNTLVEQTPTASTPTTSVGGLRGRSRTSSQSSQKQEPRLALTLNQIENRPQPRRPSGYRELDRVLGGGIVPGSLVLVGGDPGIGKSTLLLQVANYLGTQTRVLYVCAEESGQQVKLRSQRLGIGREPSCEPSIEPSKEPQPTASPQKKQGGNRSAQEDAQNNLYLLPEIDLETILMELESLRPTVAVVDSIQALYYGALTSAPGSVSQVRECTSALMQVAKREDITLFIVGHVTKEGAIAGPKVLEHLVDTVLYFEGDRFASHRLLRSVKNRFGATHELGIFEMVERGLQEVRNPSALFLGNR